jgi:hypothetical protein
MNIVMKAIFSEGPRGDKETKNKHGHCTTPCSLTYAKNNFIDLGRNVWEELGRMYWMRGLGGRVSIEVKLIYALRPYASAEFFQS